MLACTALVGCTDEIVVNEGGNEKQESIKMNTYVAISIDASTSSSRAENIGDKDGTAEDSGHKNTGSTKENEIKEILVVLTAGEYNATEGQENGIVDLVNADTFDSANGIYTKKAPYRMGQTGDYKVLLVVNPVDGLKNHIFNANDDKNYEQDHAAAYEEILKYAGESITSDGYFMMANQKPVTITVTEAHNSPDNAAGKDGNSIISVERAASKITFRWKAADTAAGIGANVYPVTVNTKAYQALVEYYWFLEGEDYKWAKFNVATVGNQTYYVLLTSATNTEVGGQLDVSKIKGIYQKQFEADGTTLKTHNGHNGTEYIERALLKDVTTEVKGTSADLKAFVSTLTFTQTETTNPADKTYYIKLEKYALANLSKTVYAVRHVSAGTKSAYSGDVKTLELMSDAYPYLIDPNSKVKANGYDAASASTWFTNPLEDVETAANTLGTSSESTNITFNSLPIGLSDTDPDKVTGVTGGTPEYNTTGAYLAYCHENAVLADKQVRGLVTGIVFVGKIYSSKECTAAQTVQKMYRYNNLYYETLRSLLNANTTVAEFANLTENSTDTQVTAAGIDVYNGGTCFYYSAQIEHFDNDEVVTNSDGTTTFVEKGAGIMEHAIMRNNIYSLSVKGLSEVGSATLKLDAGEIVADQGAYITMQARILPWIVRFNDIEF